MHRLARIFQEIDQQDHSTFLASIPRGVHDRVVKYQTTPTLPITRLGTDPQRAVRRNDKPEMTPQHLVRVSAMRLDLRPGCHPGETGRRHSRDRFHQAGSFGAQRTRRVEPLSEGIEPKDLPAPVVKGALGPVDENGFLQSQELASDGFPMSLQFGDVRKAIGWNKHGRRGRFGKRLKAGSGSNGKSFVLLSRGVEYRQASSHQRTLPDMLQIATLAGSPLA